MCIYSHVNKRCERNRMNSKRSVCYVHGMCVCFHVIAKITHTFTHSHIKYYMRHQLNSLQKHYKSNRKSVISFFHVLPFGTFPLHYRIRWDGTWWNEERQTPHMTSIRVLSDKRPDSVCNLRNLRNDLIQNPKHISSSKERCTVSKEWEERKSHLNVCVCTTLE